MQQIRARQLADWLSDRERPQPLLLDVREPWEFELCNIPGSLPMPMNSVPARQSELPADSDIVVICHHGGRSMQVGYFLERMGFAEVINLSGGIDAWAREVAPECPRY